MTVHTQSWEVRLIALAQEALESHKAAFALHHDNPALEAAYHHCEQVTKEHSRTFYLASSLLPKPKRRAVRALYAFCRVCDNLVDQPTPESDPRGSLDRWRDQVNALHPGADDPVALAWADTRARYHIPWRYAEQLIEGVSRDLHTVRYSDFSELAEYCYGVASTVGLMAMHITGFAGPDAIPYAVKLGVALQLTNILRDVAEDWRNDRVYLPQQELAAFGLSEADLAAGQITEPWREFMRFQIERNRTFYREALPGVALLDPDGRFAIRAAAELYCGILDDIEAHDYDVFTRRAHLTTGRKLVLLPGIWQRSRHTNRAVTG